MKLEIFNQVDKDKEEPVRLAFREYRDTIIVMAVDKNGNHIERGNLLGFTPSGEVYFYGWINPDLGFKLDEEGRLTVKIGMTMSYPAESPSPVNPLLHYTGPVTDEGKIPPKEINDAG